MGVSATRATCKNQDRSSEDTCVLPIRRIRGGILLRDSARRWKHFHFPRGLLPCSLVPRIEFFPGTTHMWLGTTPSAPRKELSDYEQPISTSEHLPTF